MAPNDLEGAARRLRAAWRQLHGVDLFRSITRDLQVATGARHGAMVVHGPQRPLVAAASDSRAAALDALAGSRFSPGWFALLSGAVVAIDDVLDAAEDHDPWCALAVASNVIAVLSVPLGAGYGTVAAVTLFSDEPAHFTAARVAIATAIAAIATDIVVAELASTVVDRSSGWDAAGSGGTGWDAAGSGGTGWDAAGSGGTGRAISGSGATTWATTGRKATGWEAIGWGAAGGASPRVTRPLRGGSGSPGRQRGFHLLRDLVRREAAQVLRTKIAVDAAWASPAARPDEGGSEASGP